MDKAGNAISVPSPAKPREIHFDLNSNQFEELETEGYDSDGDLGPFYDAVLDEEDPEHYSEEELPSSEVTQAREDAGLTTNVIEGEGEGSPVPATDPTMTAEAVVQLNVAQLKEELGKRGLSKTGRKAVLS